MTSDNIFVKQISCERETSSKKKKSINEKKAEEEIGKKIMLSRFPAP
jgi:hypothetical protein